MAALSLDVRSDAIAVLTIDQPGRKANVMTVELLTELEAMVAALALRTDLCGLVIASSKPGIFVAGADLNLFANAGPNDPAVRAFIDQGNRVLFALEALPFPTCAAIDGAALGGGLELALACDYRLCGSSPKVMMGLPEATLGLIPGWGGTQRLARIAGMINAASVLCRDNNLNVRGAAHFEFIDVVVDSADLLPMALNDSSTTHRNHFPQRRAERTSPVAPARRATIPLPPLGTPIAKIEAVNVMISGADLPLREGIALETEAFMRLAGSPESKRLIAEFFASRSK